MSEIRQGEPQRMQTGKRRELLCADPHSLQRNALTRECPQLERW